MLAVTGCTPPPTAHKENDDGGDANEENDIDADKWTQDDPISPKILCQIIDLF